MKIYPKKLRVKGWTDADIKRAMLILERAEKKKHPAHFFLDKIVFIIALLLAVVANILIAVRVIPLLATLSDAYLHIILILVGLAFGSLFSLLIHDIEKLSFGHHLIATLVMPITAILSMFIIIGETNNLTYIAGFQHHNPLITGLVYAIAFLIPYIIYLIVLRRKWI